MTNTNIKTLMPGLVEVDFTTSFTFLQKYTTYISFVEGFKQEVELYFDYSTSQASADFVTANAACFARANQKFIDIDNEFIVPYLRRYDTFAAPIKAYIKSYIDANYKFNFFAPISDSIGLLANTESILTDSVLPLNDVDVALYPAPTVFAISTRNKIRTPTKSLAAEMSKKTTNLMRRNLINVQVVYATSAEAHGSNLITDFTSYTRARESVLELVTALSDDFAEVFKLITYVSNINDFTAYNAGDPETNLQQFDRVKYTAPFEGSTLELDLLGKRITTARKAITNKQILATIDAQQSQTKVNNTQGINALSTSTKAVPVNSTAFAKSTVKTPHIPTPVASLPTSTAASTIVEQRGAAPVQTRVLSENPTTSIIPTAVPEFSRDVYALSSESPFTQLQSIKGLACKLGSVGKQTLSTLGHFSLPKMPSFYKNFSFKNISNPIKTLLIKAEVTIIRRLTSLIPAVPKMPNLKKTFVDFAKRLFSCNPGNKR